MVKGKVHIYKEQKKLLRSLSWLAILFNSSFSRYVEMCRATNNSSPATRGCNENI